MSYYNISWYHVTPSAWDVKGIIDAEGKIWNATLNYENSARPLSLFLSSPFLAMGLKWHTVFLTGLNVKKLKEAQDNTASHPSLLIIRNTIYNIINDIIYWKWKLYRQNETRTTFYHLLFLNTRFIQAILLLLSDSTDQISFIQRLVRK